MKNELNVRCGMSKNMLPAIQAEQAVSVYVDRTRALLGGPM